MKCQIWKTEIPVKTVIRSVPRNGWGGNIALEMPVNQAVIPAMTAMMGAAVALLISIFMRVIRPYIPSYDARFGLVFSE